MTRVRPLAVLAAVLPASTAFAAEGSHLGVPDSLWLPANLALFLYLLYRFVGKPMGRFLESRRAEIEAQLADARRKLAEAEELRTQVLARLDQVESEVAGLRERARREGEAEAVEIRAQAETEEERFLRRIDDEIARRTAETQARLAEETALLTARLTREVLQREITSDDRRRIFDRSVTVLEKEH